MSLCECQHVGVRDIATRNLRWVVLKAHVDFERNANDASHTQTHTYMLPSQHSQLLHVV